MPPKPIELADAQRNGIIVLIAAAVLTVVCWGAGYMMMGS